MTPSIPGITIYNKCKKENPENGRQEDAWNRTQIHGVHWTGANTAATVSMGVDPSAKYFCRIPITAKIEGNKTYIEPPKTYVINEHPNTWTAQPGDYVFKALISDDEPPTDSTVYYEVSVAADNRNPRLTKRTQHWRIDLR